MERVGVQTVTAAEVSRNFGLWQDRASHGPLIVTHHGRPRIAMLAIDAYDSLTRNGSSQAESGGDEMKVTMLAENVVGCFAAFDSDLRFTHVNSEAAVYFSKPVESLIGRGLTDVFPVLKDDPGLAALRRVAGGAEAERLDVPSRLYPGRVMKLSIFSYPNGVAMIFRSVALETQIAHDSSEREALFEAGDIHGGTAVTRLTLRSTFERGDSNLARLAELPPERLRNARLVDLLVPKDRAEATEHLEAVLGRGEARRFQARLLTNSGKEVCVQVGLAPLREGFKIAGAMMLLTVMDSAFAGDRAATPMKAVQL